jgi:hypothetical protein
MRPSRTPHTLEQRRMQALNLLGERFPQSRCCVRSELAGAMFVAGYRRLAKVTQLRWLPNLPRVGDGA